LLNVYALLGKFAGNFGAQPVHDSARPIASGCLLLENAVGERMPDLAPVAIGTILLRHLEQVFKLILSGLSIA
jgi:hypothetical protein